VLLSWRERGPRRLQRFAGYPW